MSPRERMLAALAHREPDKVPKDAWITPPVLEMIRQKTGCDSPADHFGFECRGVDLEPTRRQTDFSVYYNALPPDARIDEWGCAEVPGSFHHFVKKEFPMKNFTSVEQVREYPFPDLTADYRHEHLDHDVARLKDRGYFVAGGGGALIFERAWYLRGYENLMVDLLTNPDLAAALLDTITDIWCCLFERFAEAGVDMLTGGDDVGMQQQMMMSPAMWRMWLKPRFAKIIKSARDVNPDVHIFYHTDGNVWPIIPDLIEIGVDVLNPVQPECLEPAEVKEKYGDRLTLWGTGSAHTMAFGTPSEVEEMVADRITRCGRGGGLVLTPCTDLEPDMSWENIVAFFDAVEKHGRYPLP